MISGWIATFLLGLQFVPVNQTPVSVCEVLQNLDRYRGQLVQIRATLGTWGDLHGDCPPLRTGDHTWISGISQALPNGEHGPVEWDVMAAFLKVQKDLTRAFRGRNDVDITATFLGRLDVRERLEVNSDGVPFGFGHLAAWPAQLVVHSVKDITTKKVPPRPRQILE